MKVKYTGPFDAVTLPFDADRNPLGHEVVRGGVVDVDDATAANLIEQTDWELADPDDPAPAAVATFDHDDSEG